MAPRAERSNSITPEGSTGPTSPTTMDDQAGPLPPPVGVLAPSSPTPMKRTWSETSALSEMENNNNNPNKKDYRDYRVRKSRLIGMVNWSHVLGTYLPHLFTIGILALLGLVIHQVIEDTIHSSHIENGTFIDNTRIVLEETSNLLRAFFHSVVVQFHFLSSNNSNNSSTEEDSVGDQYYYGGGNTATASSTSQLFSAKVKIAFLVLCLLLWVLKNDTPVYLMSFATFKAPQSWKVTHEQIIEMMRRQKCFTEDSLQFMSRILARSGTGQSTAWPPGIVQCLDDDKVTDNSIEGSRKEAETIIYDIVDQALKRANVHPKEIDVLVINCSLFSPTPSLCAMVISKFQMRSDILSYNLSGMGCGASLISVDLARRMLSTKRRGLFGGGKALVVSTEIITPNLYHGNEKGFLLQNTLFRCGGAAMILSNKWTDGRRALYKLLHIVRVQGNDDKSYNCVYETEDTKGNRGVSLSKDIVKVAGKCMEKNMTMLGPYVLPLTEQIKVVIALAGRYAIKGCKSILIQMNKEELTKKLPVIRPYVPDFKRGIDHFCIHAGGRAVIDGIEQNMKLETFHTEPSRAALLNFGNTSSSSIWYEFEYIQDIQQTNPLKKGDRIMQVAFGSGFKCTSGVWLKL